MIFRNIRNYILRLFGITKTQELIQLNARKLNETNWGLIFNFTIKDSEWFIKQQLSPGRWAIGFPAFYIIYRVLSDIKPQSILEFGLGESSKMTYQYYSFFKTPELTIIEQDEEWMTFFNENHYQIKELVKIIPIEKIQIQSKETWAYKDLINQINGKKYDFIIIDGPWGSENYSRYQMVEIINNDLFTDDFVIVIDDANREGEKQTIQLACKALETKKIKYHTGLYSGEKDTFILCSEKLKFLVSL